MYQSEQINELATAFAKAQGSMSPAIKDSINPHFKSKYADLSSIWFAIRSHLFQNNLGIVQTMDVRDGQLFLITTLLHSSGQWMRSYLPLVYEKNTCQALGASLTYMRRYSLSSMMGVISEEDDDGNGAMSLPAPPYKSPPAKPPLDPNKISFQLPSDVDAWAVDIFLSEIVARTSKSLPLLKQEASENMNGFLTAFRKWFANYELKEDKK